MQERQKTKPTLSLLRSCIKVTWKVFLFIVITGLLIDVVLQIIDKNWSKASYDLILLAMLKMDHILETISERQNIYLIVDINDEAIYFKKDKQ